MEHIGHTKRTFIVNGYSVTEEIRPHTCPACILERKAKRKIEKQRQRESVKRSVSMVCEICEHFICYVDENDLNGSHFYCGECKNKIDYEDEEGET